MYIWKCFRFEQMFHFTVKKHLKFSFGISIKPVAWLYKENVIAEITKPLPIISAEWCMLITV